MGRRYEQQQTATTDGAGSATATFRPSRYLDVASIVVSASGYSSRPSCAVYLDGVLWVSKPDGAAGSFTADPGDRVQPGQVLTVVWSGAGVAGATCLAILRGSER